MAGGHYAWKAIKGPVTLFEQENLEVGPHGKPTEERAAP
jgi:hypothetical protein